MSPATTAPKKALPGVLANRWAIALLLITVLGGLALSQLDPLVAKGLRLAQFDQFQRWSPRTYVPTAVRVVDIDEASLKALGQWPWPRSRIAELVDGLIDNGAAAVAFDVLLTEPDRTAPAAMAKQWGVPQLTALLQGVTDPDEVLANAMVGKPVVLGSNLLATATATANPTVAPKQSEQGRFRIVRSGTEAPEGWLASFSGVVWPLPMLMGAAAGVGALNPGADADGVVRRVPLLMRQGKEILPSLSAEALRVAQGARNYLIKTEDGGIQEVRIGDIAIPTNANAELWLYYTLDEPTRTVSAAQVMDKSLQREQIEGHIVLIGSSAAGLMDLRATPMGYSIPGVLTHAMALEQVLTNQHLQRPSWATAVEAGIVFFGGLLVGVFALAARIRQAALALLAVLLGTGFGAWYVFVHQQWLIDVVNPALTMLVVFAVTSGYHHRVTERQQRWLRNAFARYVSPNRVEYLLAHPDQLHLGGQRQTCSFIFTDLAGFTPMLETNDPAQLVEKLNDYLEAMLVITFKHEGTFDRFVGDAMVVIFSAPVPQEDHRQRALDCALELDAFASSYSKQLQAQGIPWGKTRIGVHCGEVIVGNFGGKTLFDYRALGDPINTSARLESVNKHLGTRMCVSQAIMEGCSGVATRTVGRLVLKGKRNALQVFTPEATLDVALCSPLAEYQAVMKQLEPGPGHNLEQAKQQLIQLAERFPNDPLVQLHLQRVNQDAKDDLIVMTEK